MYQVGQTKLMLSSPVRWLTGIMALTVLFGCLWVNAARADGRLRSARHLPSQEESISVPAGAASSKRTYRLYVPRSVADLSHQAPSRPVFLMFVFHGGGGNAASAEKSCGMDAVAEQYGFVAVYPEGLNNHWNDGRPKANPDIDDVAFIRAVVENLRGRFNVPARGVFVCGISNGAMFSNHLALKMSDAVLAAASVAGDITGADFQLLPAQPVSVMLIHGTEDGFVPFDGGVVQHTPIGGEVTSHKASFERWIAVDGGVAGGAQGGSLGGSSCQSVSSIGPAGGSMRGGRPAMVQTPAQVCTVKTASGAVVTSVVIDRGGHTWPGHPMPVLMGVDGITAMNLDASQLIGRFFADAAGF